ncbi:hypothetical protein AB4212_69545, partial [Streptomyces sp. 2MCAF27]
TALTWTDSEDVVLAEAALAALARTDRPGDHLPLLLTYAGGDRARVAVYAGTRASQYVAPARLEGLLRGVLAPGEPTAGATAAAVGVGVAVEVAPGVAAEVAEQPVPHRPADPHDPAAQARPAGPADPAAQATPVAPAVPAKVTSRKEAARLAATRLPTADAAALLADVYDAPGQDHDV